MKNLCQNKSEEAKEDAKDDGDAPVETKEGTTNDDEDAAEAEFEDDIDGNDEDVQEVVE